MPPAPSARLLLGVFTVLASVVTPGKCAAQMYTWTGTSNSNFSSSANWQGGTAPPTGGGTGLQLVFTASGATVYTAANDLGNPFRLNSLVFDTSSSGLITLGNAANNSFQFAGTSPTIALQGTGSATLSMTLSSTGSLTVAGAPPSLDQQVLTLRGNNSIPGGVTLRSGNLRLDNTGGGFAAGTGTFTVNGGSLQAAASALAGPVVLNTDLLYLGGTLTLAPGAVASGTGTGIRFLGSGGLTMQSTSTYTGATVVGPHPLGKFYSSAPGSLVLQGAGGAVASSSAVAVGPGGTVVLDNTTAPSGSLTQGRLGDATPVSLSSAGFEFLGGSASVIEQAGGVTATGYSTLRAAQASGVVGGVTFAGLNRQDRATFLFWGSNLGASGASSARLSFGAGPLADLVGGGGAAGSTTISILPYAVADNTGGNVPNTLVTYTAAGVRPLTSAEFATSLTAGSTTTDNVRLGSGVTITSPTTINSLVLQNTVGSVTVDGTAALTVTSGVILSNSNTANSISAPLAFGGREAQIFTPKDLAILGDLTGTGGFTKSGPGLLTLSGNNLGLSGPFTVNSGKVSFSTLSQLPGDGMVTFGGSANGLIGLAGLRYTGNTATVIGRDLKLNGVAEMTMVAPTNAGTLTLSGTISGPGTLAFTDANSQNGTFFVTGTNTYTGGTVVQNARVVFANAAGSATGSGDVTLLSNGIVSGNGRLAGHLTVDSVGTPNAQRIIPTGSTGIGVGRLEIGGGLDMRLGTYEWRLGALSEAAAGTNYSQIAITGGVTRLNPTAVVTLDFSGLAAGDQPTSPGNGNGFWSSPHAWTIVDWNGQGTFTGGLGGITNPSFGAGTFVLVQPGDGVILTFTPVPEPSAVLLTAAGGALLVAALRRRLWTGLRVARA